METNANISIREPGGSPQRWRVLIATFLAYFYDSYDLLILSIAMTAIMASLDINLAQGGLLVSANMIGAMVGSIVLGIVAENKGRRFTIILSCVWFGVATFPIIFIQHYGVWLVLRFFVGFGIGGVFGPAIAILSDHWKAEYRARANSLMLSTFALGGIAAALLGALTLKIDWRILFMVGVTSIICGVICYFMIPNDNVKKDKATEAAKKEKVTIGSLFTKDIAKTTILALLLNFVYMSGYWGVNFWIPTYLKTIRGLDLTLMGKFTFVVYTGMFFGYLVWASLADKIGRKKVIIICFIYDAIAVLLYLIVPDSVAFVWGAVVGFGFGGIFGVMGSYYAELFPARIRALGGGFCFNVGKLGGVLAPFTVGVIGDSYGLVTGMSITPVIFAIGIAVIAFLPETKKFNKTNGSKKELVADNANS